MRRTLTIQDRHRIAVEIIARRPISDRDDGLLPDDLDILRRVAATHFSVLSPAENYRPTGPEPISTADADRLGKLCEAGFIALADYSSTRTFPQPYVLTEAGRKALVA